MLWRRKMQDPGPRYNHSPALIAAGPHKISLAIFEACARGFEEKNGIDLTADQLAHSRLFLESGAAAVQLYLGSIEFEVNVPFITATPRGPLHFARSFTQSDAEALLNSNGAGA